MSYKPVVLRIRCKTDTMSWWSVGIGWTDRASSDKFSYREHWHIAMPIDGEWFYAHADR